MTCAGSPKISISNRSAVGDFFYGGGLLGIAVSTCGLLPKMSKSSETFLGETLGVFLGAFFLGIFSATTGASSSNPKISTSFSTAFVGDLLGLIKMVLTLGPSGGYPNLHRDFFLWKQASLARLAI